MLTFKIHILVQAISHKWKNSFLNYIIILYYFISFDMKLWTGKKLQAVLK